MINQSVGTTGMLLPNCDWPGAGHDDAKESQLTSGLTPTKLQHVINIEMKGGGMLIQLVNAVMEF